MSTNNSTVADNKVKVAVITGGNRGIGKSTVLEVARRGTGVIFTYNSHPEEAEAVVAEVKEKWRQGCCVEAGIRQCRLIWRFRRPSFTGLEERVASRQFRLPCQQCRNCSKRGLAHPARHTRLRSASDSGGTSQETSQHARLNRGLRLLRLQVAGCLCLTAYAQRCSITESLGHQPNLAQISFLIVGQNSANGSPHPLCGKIRGRERLEFSRYMLPIAE